MMIPNGTCDACEFKDECEDIRQKLYGKRGNVVIPVYDCPTVDLTVEQEA
jgi:hypothetical protein